MIVQGTERSTREVQIEMRPMDALIALRREVYKSVGINYHEAYLDQKGRVVVDSRDGGGGHSWIDTEVLIETPNEHQLKALRAFSDVYSLMIRD